MAVIQISKIQVRRGLQENLPQLASGELGWSLDERRLWIGNGTLAEGAPSTGVTEILTQYSNIVLSSTTSSSTSGNLSFTSATLVDNTTGGTVANLYINNTQSRIIDYNIVRGANTRVGTMRVTNFSGNAVIENNYTETTNIGVTLEFTANGANAQMIYTTTSIGTNATLNYYLKTFY